MIKPIRFDVAKVPKGKVDVKAERIAISGVLVLARHLN